MLLGLLGFVGFDIAYLDCYCFGLTCFVCFVVFTSFNFVVLLEGFVLIIVIVAVVF